MLVGSIANLIVVDLARRNGVAIGAWAHARIGVPVTLATLGLLNRMALTLAPSRDHAS
jgi:Na+/H+ antiporter NhaD/arsenite permease-like protein